MKLLNLAHLYASFFLITGILSSLDSKPKNDYTEILQPTAIVKIINKSQYTLENIRLYSRDFEDLKPGDSSDCKTIEFNKEKDDATILTIVEQIRFGVYLKAPVSNKTYTVIIDSIQLDKRNIFVSEIEN